jgi:hypothetical protein
MDCCSDKRMINSRTVMLPQEKYRGDSEIERTIRGFSIFVADPTILGALRFFSD